MKRVLFALVLTACQTGPGSIRKQGGKDPIYCVNDIPQAEGTAFSTCRDGAAALWICFGYQPTRCTPMRAIQSVWEGTHAQETK